MKTSDEIKKGIYCCYVDPYGRKCNECPYGLCDEKYCDFNLGADALEYIQQLEAAQQKWIRVEDRLPEKPCTVLVSVHGIILKGWYEDGSFEMISGYKFNAYDRNSVVAYWMPIPEQPKDDA